MKKDLFAIQFTGEDENIAKIEKEASPVFKHFKIDKHKDRFYLIVETIQSNYPGYITYPRIININIVKWRKSRMIISNMVKRNSRISMSLIKNPTKIPTRSQVFYFFSVFRCPCILHSL
jgi:hypothetical protein